MNAFTLNFQEDVDDYPLIQIINEVEHVEGVVTKMVYHPSEEVKRQIGPYFGIQCGVTNIRWRIIQMKFVKHTYLSQLLHETLHDIARRMKYSRDNLY